MKRLVLFAMVVMVPLACNTQAPTTTSSAKGSASNTAPTDTSPTGTGKQVDEPKTVDKDWVALFNGTDLLGWEKHGTLTGNWEVKEGMIVGGNSKKDGYLISKRGDYKDFHLKMEAKIGDKAESALYFHSNKTFNTSPVGWGAQINSSATNKARTGSLLYDKKTISSFADKLVEPNIWFTQEVIAEGSRIQIKVDGKVTVDYTDKAAKKGGKGYFAIQARGAAGANAKKGKKGGEPEVDQTIYIRKIEIKELPPTAGK